MIYTRLPAEGTYYPICKFPTNSECLIGISDAFFFFFSFFFPLLFTGVRHLAHVLTVPPAKACLLCATPAGMDLYRQAMPVGTYRVQSLGFPSSSIAVSTAVRDKVTKTVSEKQLLRNNIPSS